MKPRIALAAASFALLFSGLTLLPEDAVGQQTHSQIPL
jgi:hypothetical protein